MSIINDRYQEDLFEQAEDDAEIFHAKKTFCLEDILAEQAERDASRINKHGETITKATDFAHRYLEQITEDPLLYCYHAGQKFWDFYCKRLRDLITSDDRAKLAIFPEW